MPLPMMVTPEFVPLYVAFSRAKGLIICGTCTDRMLATIWLKLHKGLESISRHFPADAALDVPSDLVWLEHLSGIQKEYKTVFHLWCAGGCDIGLKGGFLKCGVADADAFFLTKMASWL